MPEVSYQKKISTTKNGADFFSTVPRFRLGLHRSGFDYKMVYCNLLAVNLAYETKRFY
jgi:hypothetical protein